MSESAADDEDESDPEPADVGICTRVVVMIYDGAARFPIAVNVGTREEAKGRLPEVQNPLTSPSTFGRLIRMMITTMKKRKTQQVSMTKMTVIRSNGATRETAKPTRRLSVSEEKRKARRIAKKRKEKRIACNMMVEMEG